MSLTYTRLSTRKLKQIMRYFCADLTATQATQLAGVQRKTINRWYNQFRVWIAEFQEEQVRQSSGEFELDESYFGGIKKKTHADERRKRGRGAENKIPVFGIKKRDNGTVYTKIIENASKRTIFPIIKELIQTQDSTIYTDKFKTYDGLVFDGYKHHRVNHSKRYSNQKKPTSTVLKTSGVSQSNDSPNSMDLIGKLSTCTSKSVSFDTTNSMIC